MSKFALPEFETARVKVTQGQPLTPVELFVYNNEPAGMEQEQQFRSELQAALDHVVKETADFLNQQYGPFV